ncbi:MAG: DNA repair protein RadA [Flavobacteriales bacterium]|nr:DNA repair protein RadA [Flavobacteriales bacterium]
MATKVKKSFICQNCGNHSPKWEGKCISCGEWNTYVEEVIDKQQSKRSLTPQKKNHPNLITEVKNQQLERYKVRDQELNRVLGGGIVPGSLILFGGEPGIGKSTLMLQLAIKDTYKILYVSGEESDQQIKMRADRIAISNDNCFLLTETFLPNILHHIGKIEPQIVIIDSIQTLYTSIIESSAGSISQIRECTSELIKLAKANHISIFIIGHITKDGNIAGPKVLEHMVDTVLHFEGDRNHVYRLLRTTKNRFGSTNELGIYEMLSNGLRIVDNPSDILITDREEDFSGIAIAASIEGMRPLMIEIQALVSSAAYGTPQRSTTGYDTKRLNMILAVLEKKCGFKLGLKDVFLNVAGGLKVDDPSIDLSVACAILSSNEDISIDSKTCFAAEIGLSGEIRSVNRVEQRISEAAKLGFKNIIVSKYNEKNISSLTPDINVVAVKKIEEVFEYLFG